MSTFFHVDRFGSLSPGISIDLLPHHLPGVPDSQAVESFLNTWLPGGVTRHGLVTLMASRLSVTDDELARGDADALAASRNAITELVLELVRVERHPEAPSRLQTLYAWATLEDARRFIATHPVAGGSPRIFAVEGAVGFRADMRWTASGAPAATVYRATRYWDGDSDGPDPVWELLIHPPVKVLDEAGS
jgi:hypothetical protein